MKRVLALLTAALLTLSLAACGGTASSAPVSGSSVSIASSSPASPAPSSSSAASTSASSTSASAPKPTTSTAPLRPSQQALLSDYEELLDRYNNVVDAFNADINLPTMDGLVEIGNEATAEFDKITPMMEGIDTFTDEDVKTVRQWMEDGEEYIDMLEGLVTNYGGKKYIITFPVTLTNKTGVDIHGLYMAPESDDTWGSNMLEDTFKTGKSVSTKMMITEDCKVWDLQATDISDNELNFYGLDFSKVAIPGVITITLEAAKNGEYTLTTTSDAAPAAAAATATPKPQSTPTPTPTKPPQSSSSSSSSTTRKITDAELEFVPDTIYEIGAAFDASDIKFRCRYSDGSSSRIPTDLLTIKANGTTIYNGYKFQQAGTKKIVVEYKDWVVDYTLEVVNNLSDKKVDRCELKSEAKTLKYKVGDGFRADEIVVRCYYTDGTYEDFDHYNIEFYVDKTQLRNGYKFKEAGTKTVKMKFMDYTGSFKITVTK